MNVLNALWFLAVFCIVAALSIYNDIYEQFDITLDYFSVASEIGWVFMVALVILSIYYEFYGSLYLYQWKITRFDFVCVTVFNSFSCIELGAFFLISSKIQESNYLGAAMLLCDWVLLPYFSWIAVWSRFVRRGW